VTALACFGQYLASGSYYDKYVYVWDLQEQKQIAIVNCRGPINNIFMDDRNQMMINSDEGIFMQSVNLTDMRCYSTVARLKNITSDYLYFFADGDRFLAGCDGSTLLQSRLSTYGNPTLDRRRHLESRIATVKMNTKETHVYVNAQECVYQLLADDFKREL
jgi:WD40 repeat protein